MNAEQICSLAETTKDAMELSYEHDDKAGASALAKSLAALVAAVAGQIAAGEVSEIAGQIKVA